MLVDSHCHLAMAQFDADRPAALARARAAGVRAVIDVGIEPASWARTLALAAAQRQCSPTAPAVYAALGLHPNETTGEESDRQALAQLPAWLQSPGVVAVGETGLDYHWDRAPRAAQRSVFIQHLALARVSQLPVIIHCREAYDDLLAVLAESGQGTRGVLHCFAGSLAQMERGLALGYWISLAGPVTYKNAHNLRTVAAAVPADRLLVETDAPYLTPHPHRGQRNEPARVGLVAAAVAAARGEETTALIEQTGRNAAALFGLAPSA